MSERIVGQMITLPKTGKDPQRQVFVGKKNDGSPELYIHLMGAGFSPFRFKLSPAAGVALRTLLYTDEQRGEPVEFEIDETDDGRKEMVSYLQRRWVRVEPPK